LGDVKLIKREDLIQSLERLIENDNKISTIIREFGNDIIIAEKH